MAGVEARLAAVEETIRQRDAGEAALLSKIQVLESYMQTNLSVSPQFLLDIENVIKTSAALNRKTSNLERQLGAAQAEIQHLNSTCRGLQDLCLRAENDLCPSPQPEPRSPPPVPLSPNQYAPELREEMVTLARAQQHDRTLSAQLQESVAALSSSLTQGLSQLRGEIHRQVQAESEARHKAHAVYVTSFERLTGLTDELSADIARMMGVLKRRKEKEKERENNREHPQPEGAANPTEWVVCMAHPEATAALDAHTLQLRQLDEKLHELQARQDAAESEATAAERRHRRSFMQLESALTNCVDEAYVARAVSSEADRLCVLLQERPIEAAKQLAQRTDQLVELTTRHGVAIRDLQARLADTELLFAESSSQRRQQTQEVSELREDVTRMLHERTETFEHLRTEVRTAETQQQQRLRELEATVGNLQRMAAAPVAEFQAEVRGLHTLVQRHTVEIERVSSHVQERLTAAEAADLVVRQASDLNSRQTAAVEDLRQQILVLEERLQEVSINSSARPGGDVRIFDESSPAHEARIAETETRLTLTLEHQAALTAQTLEHISVALRDEGERRSELRRATEQALQSLRSEVARQIQELQTEVQCSLFQVQSQQTTAESSHASTEAALPALLESVSRHNAEMDHLLGLVQERPTSQEVRELLAQHVERNSAGTAALLELHVQLADLERKWGEAESEREQIRSTVSRLREDLRTVSEEATERRFERSATSLRSEIERSVVQVVENSRAKVETEMAKLRDTAALHSAEIERATSLVLERPTLAEATALVALQTEHLVDRPGLTAALLEVQVQHSDVERRVSVLETERQRTQLEFTSFIAQHNATLQDSQRRLSESWQRIELVERLTQQLSEVEAKLATELSGAAAMLPGLRQSIEQLQRTSEDQRRELARVEEAAASNTAAAASAVNERVDHIASEIQGRPTLAEVAALLTQQVDPLVDRGMLATAVAELKLQIAGVENHAESAAVEHRRVVEAVEAVRGEVAQCVRNEQEQRGHWGEVHHTVEQRLNGLRVEVEHLLSQHGVYSEVRSWLNDMEARKVGRSDLEERLATVDESVESLRRSVLSLEVERSRRGSVAGGTPLASSEPRTPDPSALHSLLRRTAAVQ